MKLDRMYEILRRLENPHKKLPPIIHVAGTNGKGSTIAFLKAIFTAAGYKVHQYTSPHLIRFNERIILANEKISDGQLFGIMEECRVVGDDLNLTFFEATTAAAFLAFSRIKADVMLVETGLGGRLDATNVMENVLLSIITPISYDHMEFLGESLLEIANEKAGIIKNNSTCVISWQESEVLDFLIQKCEKKKTISYAWQRDWNFAKINDGFLFLELLKGEEFNFPMPSLKGIHQIVNASTAIAAVKSISGQFAISNDDIKTGLLKAYWPARMQEIKSGAFISLLPKNSEIWLDGAHNVAGAQMIAATLSTLPPMPTFLINGRSKDRDIIGFLMCFEDKVEHVFAVPIEWEPYSESPKKIEMAAKKLGIKATECDSLTEAMQKCGELSKGRAVRILICGSLYLMGDVLNLMRN
ncbi:bifunctional folylpolyglutamate synthase/dihydrofolate synthase [Candidatus Bandiella euplotis]|uniref:bifunctional folylpolyglutamate synthase/dihydrofolate synthase n=1 Tax=Candidatus Bandiella euplotis TaxID=1664265 RepID=UPI002B2574F4|nr:folylpolyglutamate synthase/dihydrofolate synthase family protein [Candidatus Bandiella woodruffii]